MSPVRVRSSSSTALARPKSVTQTTPWTSSSRFDGLMSRWSMPCRWAYSRASATWSPIRATLPRSASDSVAAASVECPRIALGRAARRVSEPRPRATGRRRVRGLRAGRGLPGRA